MSNMLFYSNHTINSMLQRNSFCLFDMLQEMSTKSFLIKVFGRYTTISIKQNESNMLKPTIPIEVIDLLFYPRTNSKEREQDGMDRFFQQLLDTTVTLKMNSLHDNSFTSSELESTSLITILYNFPVMIAVSR
ncbi:hypothetical protein BDEG_24070 [Batrachochytrium dendrobatidis JEL423]|uniref:Uncharacterized protein n=1 Tax=Batrachochytrium dendrobatidis (strain JEL423) TaxID=403673 RepID=A0A177WJR7_BATDL|nr:hypothetical protein BDEG_24070 [Batrachochytrium dendrobatidis JEL423]